MSLLSIARHESFNSGRFDLGNMIQAIDSLGYGAPFETTFLAGGQGSRLAVHVDPALAVYAPVWFATDSVHAVLATQATLVALGAIPSYILASRWCSSEALGLAAAAVYLLYPPLWYGVLYDLHPVVLAAPALMTSILLVDRGRWSALPVAGLALLTKEHVGLAVVLLGLWGIAIGHRRLGSALASIGAVWSLTAILIVIPRVAERSEVLGGHASRYQALTQGGVAERAGAFADRVRDPGAWEVLIALIEPLGPWLLFAPLLALGAAPEVLVNLLSSFNLQRTIWFQYWAVATPFLIAATFLGLARVLRLKRARVLADRPVLVALVLVGWAALAAVRQGPLVALPIAPQSTALPPDGEIPPHARITATDDVDVASLREAVKAVPDDVSASVSNRTGAHLSDRRRLSLFPVVRDARYVLVDRLDRGPLGAGDRFERCLRLIDGSPDWELRYRSTSGDIRVYALRPGRQPGDPGVVPGLATRGDASTGTSITSVRPPQTWRDC